MNFKEYNSYFQSIVENPTPPSPYDEEMYKEYTRLNYKRTQRWLKHAEFLPELKALIESPATPNNWVLITEPWCGDAAHSVPVIQLLSELNPSVHVEIQLRDSNSEIDNYLTRGGKSIPVLIVRDETGKDLFHWGPRPAGCQEVFDKLKEEGADFEQQKIALQNWYNNDKGVSIQQELLEKFRAAVH